MITEYPESVSEEYHQTLVNQSTASGKVTDFQQKNILSENLSTYMSIQEKRNGNTVVDCITNTNFRDSYIIYSQ